MSGFVVELEMNVTFLVRRTKDDVLNRDWSGREALGSISGEQRKLSFPDTDQDSLQSEKNAPHGVERKSGTPRAKKPVSKSRSYVKGAHP